jgi:Domain of unknown function (DUF892)
MTVRPNECVTRTARPDSPTLKFSSKHEELNVSEAKTLHDAFLDELRDASDAEKQLTKLLPKMAKATTSPDLPAAFEAHSSRMLKNRS